MIKTNDKNICCGCGACALVCPRECISFSEDAIGARYPQIDTEKCINCRICESICPLQNIERKYPIGKKVYAAYSKNVDTRFFGSSGGMFETFANAIIREGGSVFASRFSDDLKLRCYEARTSSEVRLLTKSKYLQSDCVIEFSNIKKRVLEGKNILFCSTPCQVSALKNYLGDVSYKNNIILIDFFCHGVPSQAFFDKCISYIEKKENIKIIDYCFRTKIKNGATPHYFTIKFVKNGKNIEKTKLYYKDPFYNGFQKYITLRDSCYNCPYGNGNHAGDITIGDFHDIDKYVNGINRFDGVSTVIINTPKGNSLWDIVKNDLIIHELNIQKLLDDKVIYSGGSDKPSDREEFIKDISSIEFDIVIKKWLSSKNDWKKDIYYSLPLFMRNKIKKMVGLIN